VSGWFIVLEGPEGAGKSTVARALAARLQAEGREVIATREPGGTALGEAIRSLLLDPASAAMLPGTEALLYAAARAQHVGELIRPAVARGAIVVCDRFVDSSLAYQAGGRGLPYADVVAAQRLALCGLRPDLKILLDLPVAEGLARRFGSGEAPNRLDLAELAFHERVRTAYHDLVRADPADWAVIDARQPPDVVAEAAWAVVAARLPATAAGGFGLRERNGIGE
jgi:dTMP kinase